MTKIICSLSISLLFCAMCPSPEGAGPGGAGVWTTPHRNSQEPQKLRVDTGGTGIDSVIVDEWPTPISRPQAKYPKAALKEKIQGKVFVNLLLGVDGKPKDAKILKSDSEALSHAALEAAKKWVFKPAIYKGKPISVWVVIPFNFVLKEHP
jgi:TonB family protein